MKKWIFLIALFISSYALFAWGHPNNRSHTHHKRNNLNKIINNYYGIDNHPYHDHGHSYPICTHHGCQTPCQHTVHTCPLITTNVVFPVIPTWFTINIQASLFNVCQNRYQWCLWNTPFYLQGICTDQYFYCTGYNPYFYNPYLYYHPY